MNNKLSDIKKYALVVNDEYATSFYYASKGSSEVELVTAALQSNPTIVSIPSDTPSSGKYNIFINNELVGFFYYVNDNSLYSNAEAITAALSSDPIVVDITDKGTPSSDKKWTWTGTEFIEKI